MNHIAEPEFLHLLLHLQTFNHEPVDAFVWLQLNLSFSHVVGQHTTDDEIAQPSVGEELISHADELIGTWRVERDDNLVFPKEGEQQAESQQNKRIMLPAIGVYSLDVRRQFLQTR